MRTSMATVKSMQFILIRREAEGFGLVWAPMTGLHPHRCGCNMGIRRRIKYNMRMSMETETPTRCTLTRCEAEAFGLACLKGSDLSRQRCGYNTVSLHRTRSS